MDRWQVLFQSAVRSWLDTDPDASEVRMVAEWIEGVGQCGPAADAVEVWDDDLYLIKVPRIELWARCFILVDEPLVIIDRLYRPRDNLHPASPAAQPAFCNLRCKCVTLLLLAV